MTGYAFVRNLSKMGCAVSTGRGFFTMDSLRQVAPTRRRRRGRHTVSDPFFLPAGAKAYRRDIPEADIRFFDTGHFALETHAAPIGAAIREYFSE